MTDGEYDFYKITKNVRPRKHLSDALIFGTHRGIALDVGAGALRDTKLLLSEGFEKVIALDKRAEVAGFAQELLNSKLEVVISDFSDFNFTPDTYDMLNAQYSLPFMNKETFKGAVENILLSVKKDGIFTGTFFGENDTCNNEEYDMGITSKKEVLNFFKNFKILSFLEKERDIIIDDKQTIHRHSYHVIARRKL